ncbi:hypothetical protein V9K97_02220 [Variovorax sp. CCNWLW186]|uniref:hypothetical protein n=1 Tax=Variovorax sp. CCNWLW186 TaxID=3127473 RepID=UPI003076A039
MNAVTIDLAKYNGPVYTGRERGKQLREKLALDKFDSEEADVTIVIPEGTYTVTSSFFLGLLGPSVIRCGSKGAFFHRFHFQAPDFLKPEVEGYVARALQQRNLFA